MISKQRAGLAAILAAGGVAATSSMQGCVPAAIVGAAMIYEADRNHQTQIQAAQILASQNNRPTTRGPYWSGEPSYEYENGVTFRLNSGYASNRDGFGVFQLYPEGVQWVGQERGGWASIPYSDIREVSVGPGNFWDGFPGIEITTNNHSYYSFFFGANKRDYLPPIEQAIRKGMNRSRLMVQK